MKNQIFKSGIVKCFVLFMCFQYVLHGQSPNYPGPGNTTIGDRGDIIIIWTDDEDLDDISVIDCERHPKLCGDIREKHPNPDAPGKSPGDGDGKKKDKKKKPKKQSLIYGNPPPVSDERIAEFKKSSKTGMANFKNGKWLDIVDFNGHLESLIYKNN